MRVADRSIRLTLCAASERPSLALGRAHEVSGPARRTFAAMAAGRMTGPVLWALGRGAGATGRMRLHPEGLWPFLDPARVVFARCPRSGVDALWAAEEALRSGAVPLVVVEPPRPPGLTPVRRLQLAAEAGGRAPCARRPPLCLILTPEGGSAAAVESRWRAEPAPGWALGGPGAAGGVGQGPPRWRLALARDKAGPPGLWEAAASAPAPARARAVLRSAARG